MEPVQTSRNPLAWIPAPAKAAAYSFLLFMFIVFTCWQAADGDWAEFVLGVFSALGFATATSNVSHRKHKPPTDERGHTTLELVLIAAAVAIVVLAIYVLAFDGKH